MNLDFERFATRLEIACVNLLEAASIAEFGLRRPEFDFTVACHLLAEIAAKARDEKLWAAYKVHRALTMAPWSRPKRANGGHQKDPMKSEEKREFFKRIGAKGGSQTSYQKTLAARSNASRPRMRRTIAALVMLK